MPRYMVETVSRTRTIYEVNAKNITHVHDKFSAEDAPGHWAIVEIDFGQEEIQAVRPL